VTERFDDLAGATALTVGAASVFAAYILPWYTVWALPVAALSRRRAIVALVAVHAAFIVAAYQAGSARVGDVVLRGTVTTVAPLVTVAAFVATVALGAATVTPPRGRARLLRMRA